MVTTLSSVVAKMLLCCTILRNCGHHIWPARLLHNPSGTPMPSNLFLVPIFCICQIIRKEGSNSASTGHMSADRHEIFLTRLICRRPTMFYNQLIVMHRKFGTNAPTSIIWSGKLLQVKCRCTHRTYIYLYIEITSQIIIFFLYRSVSWGRTSILRRQTNTDTVGRQEQTKSNMEKVFQLVRRFHFLDIPQKRTPDVWAKSSNFLAVV